MECTHFVCGLIWIHFIHTQKVTSKCIRPTFKMRLSSHQNTPLEMNPLRLCYNVSRGVISIETNWAVPFECHTQMLDWCINYFLRYIVIIKMKMFVSPNQKEIQRGREREKNYKGNGEIHFLDTFAATNFQLNFRFPYDIFISISDRNGMQFTWEICLAQDKKKSLFMQLTFNSCLQSIQHCRPSHWLAYWVCYCYFICLRLHASSVRSMQIFAYANNKSIVMYIDAVLASCNKLADIAVVAITSKPNTN